MKENVLYKVEFRRKPLKDTVALEKYCWRQLQLISNWKRRLAKIHNEKKKFLELPKFILVRTFFIIGFTNS